MTLQRKPQGRARTVSAPPAYIAAADHLSIDSSSSDTPSRSEFDRKEGRRSPWASRLLTNAHGISQNAVALFRNCSAIWIKLTPGNQIGRCLTRSQSITGTMNDGCCIWDLHDGKTSTIQVPGVMARPKSNTALSARSTRGSSSCGSTVYP